MSDMPPRRGRARIGAAARKIAQAAETRNVDEADTIGLGVRAVAREIVPHVEPGSLYWRAPLQFVAEQMAPRVAKQHKVPTARTDELSAYLLAAINEYMIALAGEFDMAHFDAWSAAMLAAEEARS